MHAEGATEEQAASARSSAWATPSSSSNASVPQTAVRSCLSHDVVSRDPSAGRPRWQAMPLDGSLYDLLERRRRCRWNTVIVTVAPMRADRLLARRLHNRVGAHAPGTCARWTTRREGEPLLLSLEHPPGRCVRVHRGPSWTGKEIDVMTERGQGDAAQAGDRSRTGVSVICALDHGMTSPTFLEPLADIDSSARGKRWRGGAERDHDEQGDDPASPHAAFSPTTSLAMLLSASATPDAERPDDRADRRGRGGSHRSAPTPSCCSPRSVATPRPA